jgi:hypothetical protein
MPFNILTKIHISEHLFRIIIEADLFFIYHTNIMAIKESAHPVIFSINIPFYSRYAVFGMYCMQGLIITINRRDNNIIKFRDSVIYLMNSVLRKGISQGNINILSASSFCTAVLSPLWDRVPELYLECRQIKKAEFDGIICN